MLAIFVDGPLVGTMQEIPPVRSWEVNLPDRWTNCTCDPEEDFLVHDAPAETVTYHVVMHGLDRRVAMLSLKDNEDAVLDSLKNWTMANFADERWIRHCRSERAFT